MVSVISKIVSEYDQEVPHSLTAGKPMVSILCITLSSCVSCNFKQCTCTCLSAMRHTHLLLDIVRVYKNNLVWASDEN